jgi:hypothetical protein
VAGGALFFLSLWFCRGGEEGTGDGAAAGLAEMLRGERGAFGR